MNKDEPIAPPAKSQIVTQASSQHLITRGHKLPTRPSRIDFSRLPWGTLRKCQYYFRIADPEGLSSTTEYQDRKTEADKMLISEAVKSHFEELKLDNVNLVAKFLRIKKDEKDNLNYNLRKPNRSRAGAAAIANNSDLMFQN
ncbi:hypothetical protein FGO68_gene252 [Halteria grandinella]|uniref:Histone deacetylase complex subunit SAP30 Sin3 binding domain-containing protein n=1 Tax=Halteria grandinella TaxID=5974 RepID=A0A8J8NDM9_HALGN|nr:hypothetical protein FGO68_gene252 [Halteria grandinella]